MLDDLLAPGFADCSGVQTADFDYWEMGGGGDWMYCCNCGFFVPQKRDHLCLKLIYFILLCCLR